MKKILKQVSTTMSVEFLSDHDQTIKAARKNIGKVYNIMNKIRAFRDRETNLDETDKAAWTRVPVGRVHTRTRTPNARVEEQPSTPSAEQVGSAGVGPHDRLAALVPASPSPREAPTLHDTDAPRLIFYGPVHEATSGFNDEHQAEMDILITNLNRDVDDEDIQEHYSYDNLLELIVKLRRRTSEKAEKFYRLKRAELKSKLDCSRKGPAKMYKLMRMQDRVFTKVIWDGGSKMPTANIPRLHEIFRGKAFKLYNKYLDGVDSKLVVQG